jgi:GNAT superfamily N-acetyltransferase
MSVRIVDVTAADGTLLEPGWIEPAYPVHAQLRPHVTADQYPALMRDVFAGGGRMIVALVERDGTDAVAGVGVYRFYANTHAGMRFYVDDLVTDSMQRSTGVGRAMLDGLRDRARALGCRSFELDSGTHRVDAHRFYFRERMSIVSFSFKQAI